MPLAAALLYARKEMRRAYVYVYTHFRRQKRVKWNMTHQEERAGVCFSWGKKRDGLKGGAWIREAADEAAGLETR